MICSSGLWGSRHMFNVVLNVILVTTVWATLPFRSKLFDKLVLVLYFVWRFKGQYFVLINNGRFIYLM
ncbi:hypothetical protein HanPSC8_Chr07g0303161 [Helianthus annuus]|nr:hypothetical protein HanPSC8_Chr07g0303161 [Helianthus annuus]